MHHRLTAATALGFLLTLGGASTAQAQSIDPPTYSATMTVGQTIIINKTITLGPSGANLVDLFFLADNTGSMFGIVNNAKSGANTILNNLNTAVDYNFGVGRYLGDPSEGVPPNTAYLQNTAMTSDKDAAVAGINAWFASGGGDYPEANTYALKRVAEEAAWRAGSQRLLIWFGDAPGWEKTTTMLEAIAALNAAGIKVIAFNSVGANFGIDDNRYGGSGITPNQATKIVAATGGSLTNNFGALSQAAFVQKINDEISLASATLDLIFGHSAGSGLSISFVCTDPLGCTDVGGGESRTFDVYITALAVGTYDFSIFAEGVSAEELDRIVVVSATVPEPSTLILLGTGLMGLGFGAWRRKEDDELA